MLKYVLRAVRASNYLVEIRLNTTRGRVLVGGGVAKESLKGWERRGGFRSCIYIYNRS
jgi:hypothetical protein